MSDEDVSEISLDQLVLIVGLSTAGKSASLRNIRNQQNWMYLGTEAGKRLPFQNKFQRFNITDPFQVEEAFIYATEEDPSVEGMIVDSMTFLMDMFETQYVLGSSNTMQGWSDYAQFFKRIMQSHVPTFGKSVIIIAHVKDELDEKAGEMKTFVPIKGALKNNGVEALVISALAA
ncbi:MAG: AAA family ATPase [Sphaerochaetaceae bacterium]